MLAREGGEGFEGSSRVCLGGTPLSSFPLLWDQAAACAVTSVIWFQLLTWEVTQTTRLALLKKNKENHVTSAVWSGRQETSSVDTCDQASLWWPDGGVMPA